MQLSFVTFCKDVNIPDKFGDILIRSDAWSPVISSLYVKVDNFYVNSSNLLIIRTFCQYFVDKKFERRSGVCDTENQAVMNICNS